MHSMCASARALFTTIPKMIWLQRQIYTGDKERERKKNSNCTSVSSSFFFIVIIRSSCQTYRWLCLAGSFFSFLLHKRWILWRFSRYISHYVFFSCFAHLLFSCFLWRHCSDQCVMTCDDHEMAKTWQTCALTNILAKNFLRFLWLLFKVYQHSSFFLICCGCC